jgi:hypothetical protein
MARSGVVAGRSTQSLDMAIDLANAERLALHATAGGFRDSISLTPIVELPSIAYNFDPSGWLIFSVTHKNAHHVGSTEYVAVHGETCEFRNLGFIGE